MKTTKINKIRNEIHDFRAEHRSKSADWMIELAPAVRRIAKRFCCEELKLLNCAYDSLPWPEMVLIETSSTVCDEQCPSVFCQTVAVWVEHLLGYDSDDCFVGTHDKLGGLGTHCDLPEKILSLSNADAAALEAVLVSMRSMPEAFSCRYWSPESVTLRLLRADGELLVSANLWRAKGQLYRRHSPKSKRRTNI